MLYDEGGSGRSILLLHGLMGSAATWRRQVPWLREFGHVHTYDAPGHRRPAPAELTTESFVADLLQNLEWLGPSVLIGHSMGALHAWCAAARRPDLVTALVVEDIAPDFRGRTADDWATMMRAWPQPFPDADAVRAFFGDVAGQYFLDSFERDDDGWGLHGDIDTFEAISQEWGTRHFWDEWDAVDAPVLLIEGEHTITPAGQMRQMHVRNAESTYVRIENAAHLIHDECPERYRTAVEGFLRTLR
ncbi:alpha/beta hydrolase [Rhodococcus sp. 15-649-2-2]|uniref:alpha/beta fold hydrolase n=1 Tax=Rhodococcus sp. 15-649-2-2 TaxID=2023140 RepID=UPI000B9B5244|nr:alpha/beta hydrolase [Rhodococcus sp. 15-649-2-2]OZE80394.1 alpha/beta hydrolase [Rhodococcus sp. 15-649-2-2]